MGVGQGAGWKVRSQRAGWDGWLGRQLRGGLLVRTAWRLRGWLAWLWQ